jgi:hypothetical protein
MPPEAVFIVFIIFGFGFMTVKTLVSFAKWRTERKTITEGSLRTSELKQLVRDAVDEANAPLYDRIDDLEQQISAAADPPRLAARSDQILSSKLLEEVEELEEVPTRPRRRVR